MRLMIAGTNSGCGKTTVTCALLAAFKRRGLAPTAFKCGPDYIDPMFHRAVSGVRAYNLDPFFLDGDGLRALLTAREEDAYIGAGTGAEDCALSIVEGAMGFYDGIAASDEASAYVVARETATPVVLCVSARGAGASLGALIEGFARHRPDSRIAGVIFNDAAESRYADLERIAVGAGVRAFGHMPRRPEWTLPGRHLGLLTAGEIAGLKHMLSELGEQAGRTVDLDGLLELATSTSPLTSSATMPISSTPPSPEPATTPPAVAPASVVSVVNAPIRASARARLPRPHATLRLAVARDEAFCFFYEENLELLRALGCDIVFFSPLRDGAPPPDIDGLYLGGGYPELYAKILSDNTAMRGRIREAALGGLPTIAEGGGFMYLHDTLDGHPMCGVIGGAAFKTERLRRFGYITLTAERDNLLCAAGGSIRSQEFHYWDSDAPGDGFTARKAGRDTSYPCVHATATLYAGFPHLYFPAAPTFAERYVKMMYGKKYEAITMKGRRI